MARPTMDMFLVSPIANDTQKRQRWTKIGVAFSHRDQRGVSIQFHVTPSQHDLSNGNIVLRDVENIFDYNDEVFRCVRHHRCNDAACIQDQVQR